jgi:hypothetical protein
MKLQKHVQLKKSHVPPNAARFSRITKDSVGQYFCKWYPAPIPEIPAPTTIQSKYFGSAMVLNVMF